MDIDLEEDICKRLVEEDNEQLSELEDEWIFSNHSINV